MKRILFVIESLVCAGAEKSLVTLLNLIDYSKYEVDLQLFSYGGEFEAMLPKEVRLLPPLAYYESTKESLKTMVCRKKTSDEWKILVSRIKYSFSLRMGKYNNPQKAVLFWQVAKTWFKESEREYDAAIAYAQGTPTFYVADCIKAKKKYAWINVTYKLEGWYREYVMQYYKKYDRISCVSDSAYNVFKEVFPEVADKGTIIYDINDGRMIERLSKVESDATVKMKEESGRLLTVGRLAKQKGYDIAIEACKLLKERNIDFCWYVLGRGPLEQEIRDRIRENNLEERFVLLGTTSNPYPYIANADIYVQTSRLEGFGLAIAEARMLEVPVVTTRFDAVYAQMVEGENGLVTDMNGEAVADAIQRLIEDKELYKHIVEYQKKEKKGNYEELDKFYALIEGY